MSFTDRANQILATYPTLHTGGFHDKDKADGWNFDKIEKIAEFIRHNYCPASKNTPLRGSYSLKHEVEQSNWTDDSNKYVSNGELILAMLYEGYSPKHIRPDNLNCCFKVKTTYWFKEGQRVAKSRWRRTMREGDFNDTTDWERRWKENDDDWFLRATYRAGYEEAKAGIGPMLVPRPQPRPVVPV